MTIIEFCLLAAGILVNAFTFGIGLLVGACLREKAYQKNREDGVTSGEDYWHKPRVRS